MMNIDFDLFGEPVRYEKTIQEQYLRDKDEMTLGNRLNRLQFLHGINPEGLQMVGEMELVFGFREMQEAFINGHFMSTIVLGQAWMEKHLQIVLLQFHVAKQVTANLNNMIAYCRDNKIGHEYMLCKLDHFRKIRNPMMHLKQLDYEFSLPNRSLNKRKNPLVQLEEEAREMIGLCTHIALSGLH